EWVHVQLHQQKGMISLSPPTICNSAKPITPDSGLARSRATKTNAISNISFCYRASLALSSIVLF
ncbi:hypothetical protein, partial [Escherichia coli]|uniref:hypothetical protein n=1 Tax=Escherichia coli TaxID=562 RepID=UPI0032195504